MIVNISSVYAWVERGKQNTSAKLYGMRLNKFFRKKE